MGSDTSRCCQATDTDDQAKAEERSLPDWSDKLVLQHSTVDDPAQLAEKEKAKAKEAKDAAKRKKDKEHEAREKKAKEEAKKQAAKIKAEQQEVARRQKEEEEKERLLRLERLGPLGQTGAKLQIQLEDGWADCSEEELKQVCDHVAGGGTKFPIQARGAMYFIDWSNPAEITQKNVRSGKTRMLRVLSP